MAWRENREATAGTRVSDGDLQPHLGAREHRPEVELQAERSVVESHGRVQHGTNGHTPAFLIEELEAQVDGVTWARAGDIELALIGEGSSHLLLRRSDSSAQ